MGGERGGEEHQGTAVTVLSPVTRTDVQGGEEEITGERGRSKKALQLKR